MTFLPLWDAVDVHFFSPPSLSRVGGMIRAETQVESWFKQEIIELLDQLRRGGVVRSWQREYPTGQGRKKVDFKIDLSDTSTLVEIKTALCGLQKGTMWKLPNYVMAEKSGYILSDVLKLAATEAPNRFLLVFAYAASPSSDWQAMVSAVHRKAPAISVDLARVHNSPASELSIGWLRVT